MENFGKHSKTIYHAQSRIPEVEVTTSKGSLKGFATAINYLDPRSQNQVYNATDGTRYQFSQELPVISENYEVSNSFEVATYHLFPGDMIGRISFFGRNILSLGDKDVRISKQYSWCIDWYTIYISFSW